MVGKIFATRPPVTWHSASLRETYLKNENDFAKVQQALEKDGALDFPSFASGLFPASPLPLKIAKTTGMGDAWVRDSAMVAASLAGCGRIREAAKTAQALLKVFANASGLMKNIICEPKLAADVENLPPARVNGKTLAEHRKQHNAQNDSVGETLWLVAKLVSRKELVLDQEQWRTLKLIAEYLIAIKYWDSSDNGAWEEARKVEASSIGAVVAGLAKYRETMQKFGKEIPRELDFAIAKGRKSLDQILPNESCDPPELFRDADAAQLFLVEPLNIVTDEQAEIIVENISRKLVRDIGIIRYAGDSYWSPDYREKYSLEQRAQYAGEERDQFAIIGSEAQWTLFDPLLSVYYLKKFREKARWHLERSLAQFVDTSNGWRIPEAFFLEGNKWVANDHVPLLWSQANVLRMFREWAEK